MRNVAKEFPLPMMTVVMRFEENSVFRCRRKGLKLWVWILEIDAYPLTQTRLGLIRKVQDCGFMSNRIYTRGVIWPDEVGAKLTELEELVCSTTTPQRHREKHDAGCLGVLGV
jgi:hypothetical protein